MSLARVEGAHIAFAPSSRFWVLFHLLVPAYYGALALTRLIAPDEAYFLYAARLVRQGAIPYRDFFFPQMPLLPYAWGWALAPFEVTWVSGRLLAALVAWMAAYVFTRLLLPRVRQEGILVAMVVAFLLSDFGLEWATVVKTYSPAVLLSLCAMAAATGTGARQGHAFAWFWSGMSAGCALITRLTVLPLVPLILIGGLWESRATGAVARRAVAAWLVGLALPIALVLAMWRIAPVAFQYDNWVYHGLGAPTWSQRLHTNIPVALDRFLRQPIWLAALCLLARDHWRRRALAPLDWIYRLAFAAMAGVSFVPILSHQQYYAMATPWLLLGAAPALQDWWREVGSRLCSRHRWASAILAAIAVVLVLLEPYHALERRWPTWTWGSTRSEARGEFDNRLATVRAIARRVDALAPRDAAMLTWWPGYAVGTRTPLLAGLENQFGLRVGYYNHDREALRQLHVLDASDVQSIIERHAAGVVVVGLWTGDESCQSRSYYETMLAASGYVIRERIGSAAIYTAPPGG